MTTTPKRIDLSLFDDNLKTLINAAAKIFPVEYTYVSAGTNPNNYEYVKILSGDHKREIYLWMDNTWGLIGADDTDIDFSSIKNPPTSYPPSAHTHIELDITNLDKYSKSETDTLLAGKAAIDHTHAALHIHANADILAALAQTNIDLWNTVSDKAAALHNHDGRYFTETEANTLLAGKSDTNHTHAQLHGHGNLPILEKIQESVSDTNYDLHKINDHETRLSNIENGYTEGHSHANLAALNLIAYTGAQSSIDLKAIEDNTTAIAGKAATGHTHIKANITDFAHTHPQSEVTDLVTALAGKAASTHTHSQSDVTNLVTALAAKADSTTLTGHTGNATVHVTQTDKDTWGAKGDMLKSVYDTDNDGIVDNAEHASTADSLSNLTIDHIFKDLISSAYTNVDFNTLIDDGVFRIFNPSANFPSGYTSDSDFYVKVYSVDESWVRQISYDIRSNAIFTRNKYNGTWQAWERIPKFSEVLKSKSAFAGDFNNCRETGMYSINGFTGCSNYPPNAYSYGTLIVFNGSATADTYAIGQLYLAHGNSEIWYRGGYNGTSWQGWTKAYNQYTISKGTANPSGGQDGDIYLQYV